MNKTLHITRRISHRASLTCLLIAIVLILFALAANCQPAQAHMKMFGGTNNIAATATNTYAIVMPVGEFDNVGFQLSAKPLSSSTGSITFRIAKGDNQLAFESTPSLSSTLTFAGTGYVTNFVAFDCSGASHLLIVAGENTNAMAVTNIVAIFRPKATKVLATPSTQ